METKINVAEARVNGDWCNIKTSEGKEVSVMLSKCPKLKSQIEAAQAVPYELTVNLVTKGDKTYAWDLDEKKGGKGAPRNEKAIIAQSSIGYAVDYLALAIDKTGTKPVSKEQLFEAANDIYNWVCEKGGVK